MLNFMQKFVICVQFKAIYSFQIKTKNNSKNKSINIISNSIKII